MILEVQKLFKDGNNTSEILLTVRNQDHFMKISIAENKHNCLVSFLDSNQFE